MTVGRGSASVPRSAGPGVTTVALIDLAKRNLIPVLSGVRFRFCRARAFLDPCWETMSTPLQYLHPQRQGIGLTFGVLCLGTFAYTLLQSMVLPALPAIQRDLH